MNLCGALCVGLLAGAISAPVTARANPYAAQLTSQAFFTALVRGQPDIMFALCDSRVSFDGRWVAGEAALRQDLEQLVTRAKDQLLKLHEVRLVKLREMIKLFGQPPARLKSAIRPSDLIVLARFTRGGAIAVLGRKGRLWRVKALSD